MFAPDFASALRLLGQLGRLAPAGPLPLFARPRLLPPPAGFLPRLRTRQEAVLAGDGTEVRQRILIRADERPGPHPTIVLPGFVPDAPDQVLLLRPDLLRHGSVYYVDYARGGFSLDLFCAQLDDLVAELALTGRRPVLLTVSFGCGLALEWLRRCRAAGRAADIAGLVLVSPVACPADLVDPASARPATLVGRALQPYLDPTGIVSPQAIEKSRTIFLRMFEAGAQHAGLSRSGLAAEEFAGLRERVTAAIRAVDRRGAVERVGSLAGMPAPDPAGGPLTIAPALVLFAEREDTVLAANSPTRDALGRFGPVLLPLGAVHEVSNPGGDPVQHASLIFHAHCFRSLLQAFYRRLKSRKLPLAA